MLTISTEDLYVGYLVALLLVTIPDSFPHYFLCFFLLLPSLDPKIAGVKVHSLICFFETSVFMSKT